jgi:hypothetical protein
LDEKGKVAKMATPRYSQTALGGPCNIDSRKPLFDDIFKRWQMFQVGVLRNFSHNCESCHRPLFQCIKNTDKIPTSFSTVFQKANLVGGPSHPTAEFQGDVGNQFCRDIESLFTQFLKFFETQAQHIGILVDPDTG